MGQLRHGNAIFLSAGVPDPSKSHFMGEGDSAAIASAVSALLYVALGSRPLVWGGHPAITPMIWAYADAMGVDYGDWVTLYQSALFEDEFPEETALFKNVVITDVVDGGLAPSLALMRRRMLEEHDFDAAVFIGGMRGIYDEHDLFSRLAPNAKVLPIGSTGGAAESLLRDLGLDEGLASELDYVSLFHRRLAIDPAEPRILKPE